MLDRHLAQICNKQRLLELIHDFIVFDAGVKKPAVITNILVSLQRNRLFNAMKAGLSGIPRAVVKSDYGLASKMDQEKILPTAEF